MKRIGILVTLTVATLLLSGEPAGTRAAPAGASGTARGFSLRVSPSVRLWFSSPAYRRFRGRRVTGGAEAAVRLDRVGVTIRMARRGDLRRLVELEGAGLELTRIHGRIARLGRIVAARVDAQAVDRLSATDWIQRVELDMISPWDPPLDVTVPEIQADAVWATLDAAGLPLTGSGMIIADIDSGIDQLHPAFFRADGGYYDWIDVNANQRFDPGVDRVDLNQNGLADADETVDFFDGVAYDLGMFSPILGTEDGVFDLGWDHLYVDVNGNGRRDFGYEGGYTEEHPTYGEPLLVADDVNGNGILDPGERLVALGTSKIRAVYSGGDEFVRGVNLIRNVVTNDSLHGTGVSGILVGGNRGFNTLVGIAPDAELLMADTHNNPEPYGDMAPLLIWAVQEGAHVMLHEYAPWAGHFLDGSSNHEELMDSAAADHGVAQVNPAGNLGGSMKHSRFAVAAQSSLEVPVEVPNNTQPGSQDYTYLQLSFLWRDLARNLHFELAVPGGEIVSIGAAGTGNDPVILADGTTNIYAWREDSSRGTSMMQLWIFGQSGMSYVPIATGAWRMTVSDPETTDPSAAPVELSGYVMDDVSGWGLGANFPDHASEEHLVCFPATADSAIGVAAYTGHAGQPYSYSDEAQGELRRYSGRGTRVDGVSLLDITAPDNPITALNRIDYGGGYEFGLGSYLVFGGTSGAGPHVGGAAVLIKQAHPSYTGLEVRSAIREGALVDEWVVGDSTHAVQDLWGAGKLRIYQSLYGQTPAPNTAPRVALGELYATAGEPLILHPTTQDAEDGEDALQLLWDDDYDGVWDHGPTAAADDRSMTFDATGTVRIKVRVIDTGGLTGDTLATVNVLPTPTCGGALCPDGGVGNDGGPGVNPRGGCGCGAATPARSATLPILLVALFWLLRRRMP
ncbi:MAG: S8 family serine peptidase [bacterium]